MERDLTGEISRRRETARGYRHRMGDTNAARAEALAAEALAIMRKEMELENKGHVNAFANAGLGGNKWQRVQALQAQAQVHATLALAEEVARSRIGG